jgi:hypothetical protein
MPVIPHWGGRGGRIAGSRPAWAISKTLSRNLKEVERQLNPMSSISSSERGAGKEPNMPD